MAPAAYAQGMRGLPAVGLLSALVLLAGCGDGGGTRSDLSGGTPTPSSPTTSPTPQASQPSPGTVVKVAASDYGSILFDGRGQAIYLFDKETSRPDCYGACAEDWPPVLTKGSPVAGASVRGALLGTVKRTDGSTQVTYNNHPLYFYAHEEPDEVRCHNVPGFGGLWLAVTPSGEPAPR